MFTRSLMRVVVQINHIGRHIGPRRESNDTPVKNRSRFTVTVLRMSSDAFHCAGFCAKQSAARAPFGCNAWRAVQLSSCPYLVAPPTTQGMDVGPNTLTSQRLVSPAISIIR